MITEKIEAFEKLSKESRIKRLENLKEDTEREMRTIEVTIQKAKEINDILPSDSDARAEAKRFLDILKKEKGFKEDTITEITASIDYIKTETKDIKSII